RRRGPDEPDHRQHRLLRARRERPCSRAAEQRDELPPRHSITSSASPANGSGTVSPRALATLRLMTRVYLSARWIGKSPGFAPSRCHSAYFPPARSGSRSWMGAPYHISPPFRAKPAPAKTAGNRWRLANSAISVWRKRMKLSVGKIRPPFGARAKFSIAGSMSPVARTERVITSTLRDGAAASIERMKNFDWGDVSGLNMTPTRASLGAISLSRSSHLLPIANSYMLKPVRLPPGRVMLATKPCATGSET